MIIATGNITGGNLVTGGALSVTGNANVGNLGTTGLIIATGNITGGNLSVGSGYITLGNLTTGATATPGVITGNWTLSAGSMLNATYADLAECYTADSEYEPGTVLEFGGANEVTLSTDATNRVAGVVSTNPAYVMNSSCPGEHVVAIALQGRAPCKVRGTIHKGDMLIAGGDGFARPSGSPLMGTVIGKSLEDFDGVSGIIECAVGRL